MTAPIDPVTDAEIARVGEKAAEVARGVHQGYSDRVWWRETAVRLATHLAALKAAGRGVCEDAAEVEGLTISRVRTDLIAPLRALCGDGPTDLALVPAEEFARERTGHRMICDESDAYDRALTAAGAPTWNVAEDRAMGCAERVEWLAAHVKGTP